MVRTADLLSEERIRNYYSILEIARAWLNKLYKGKKMHIHISDSRSADDDYKIVRFDILPIENGVINLTGGKGKEDIFRNNNLSDLVIMVWYLNHTGNKDLAPLNAFLSANKITAL